MPEPHAPASPPTPTGAQPPRRELDAYVDAVASAGEGTRRPRPATRLIVAVWGVITLLWIVLDQATKVLAVEQLESMNRQVNLGFMLLRPLRNLNGAFGFPAFPGLFVIVAAIVLVFVIRSLPSTERVSLAAAYGLICGGALGNVADRIFRAPGFPNGGVVDFFDLRWWPVFNIADIGIVVGAFLIVILMIQAEREDRAAAAARERSASVRPDTGTPQG